MRRKEIEFEKSRAILQQKVELLEMQLNESEEREENIKKMHETMMAALQDNNCSSGLKVLIFIFTRTFSIDPSRFGNYLIFS